MAEAQPALAAVQGPNFSVVLLNVSSSDGVSEEDRQNCLKVVLDSVVFDRSLPDPCYLLCQDKITRPKHEILCQKLGWQVPEAIKHQEEAGVYYRLSLSTHGNVRYIDRDKKQYILQCMGQEAGVRLMVCELTLRYLGNFRRILLVSWHGRTKINVVLKCAYFYRLIRVCEHLRQSLACTAVVVGGDFNLPAEYAHEMKAFLRTDLSVDGVVLDKYTPPADRQGLGIIDFIFYWPQNELQSLDTRVIMPHYRREKGNRPFDHPIVAYTFGTRQPQARGQGPSRITRQTLLPVESVEAVSHLERMLMDQPAMENTILHQLQAVGGSSVKEVTKNILRYLCGPAVAEAYCWKGSPNGRECFRSLRLKDILFEAVHGNPNRRVVRNGDIKKAAQEFFKTALQRRRRRQKAVQAGVDLERMWVWVRTDP